MRFGKSKVLKLCMKPAILRQNQRSTLKYFKFSEKTVTRSSSRWYSFKQSRVTFLLMMM